MTNSVKLDNDRDVEIGDTVTLVAGHWALDKGDEYDEVFKHGSTMTVVEDSEDTIFYINRQRDKSLTVEISALLFNSSSFE